METQFLVTVLFYPASTTGDVSFAFGCGHYIACETVVIDGREKKHLHSDLQKKIDELVWKFQTSLTEKSPLYGTYHFVPLSISVTKL